MTTDATDMLVGSRATNPAIYAETLEFFAAESYRIAQEHGWWDTAEDKNIPSKIALTHSELSEMLEDFRDGNMKLRWSHKPFPPEHPQFRNFHPNMAIERRADGVVEGVLYKDSSMEWRTGLVTNEDWARFGYDSKPEGFGIEAADVLIRVFDLMGFLGIDIAEMVRIKQAYNETRPYRHGGKAV
jgi:hypothetical protein